MNRKFTILIFCLFLLQFATAQSIDNYNVIWRSQSANSSESMPCGGGDIGMNVWVERGDILFYFSRSGTFDENNTLLKLGRIRIRLTPNPFDGDYFRQELKLRQGYVEIEGQNNGIKSTVTIRADVFSPTIQIDISSNQNLAAEVFYENWRYADRPLRPGESQQNSYKWAPPQTLVTKKDNVAFEDDRIVFYHRNTATDLFDSTVAQQGLDGVKPQITNPLANLTFGGIIEAKGFGRGTVSQGAYADTDYKSWSLKSQKPTKKSTIKIKLHSAQTESVEAWRTALGAPATLDATKNATWWSALWERSFIYIDHLKPASKSFETGRNYALFRYMLACNARGDWPTKFNGGLFTYDPVYVDSTARFTPDYRKWGGGTHTAQNQRLVYFPMLKSGDVEFMKPQFDFYNRLLPIAELRSRVYWGHDGACFTEQTENFGLPNPTEYGLKRPDYFDKGIEYNAWLEYQWDTALEFCLLILESERYAGKDISEYLPLIESSLRFFDEHYQYLARMRGRKTFDQDGKLILYPGSACETYKMATNAASTVAALHTVATRLLEIPTVAADSAKTNYFTQFLSRIPEIRTREIDGHRCIAPAWLWERVNNTESPQLYPVFPWGIYGIGRPGLDIAINTWRYDPDVIKFRSHIGWKQDVIWAARLGLTDEAKDLIVKKTENATPRFPAFWGPGYDWTPDHNWGGSAMIALQEMLVQADGRTIFLLPAWPAEWDVHFKLHLPYNTTVECRQENGEIKYLKVTPQSREKDVVRVSKPGSLL